MGRVLVQQPGTNTTKASTEILPKNVIIVDEDLHQLRLHDGTTPGGHVIGSSGGGNNSNALLSFMWADHQLNDVSWLRADTFSWQSGDVYKAAYEHLVDDFENAQTSTYYAWTGEGFIAGTQETVYTTSQVPSVGDTVYYYGSDGLFLRYGTVATASSANITFTYAGDGATSSSMAYGGETLLPVHLETIGGITVAYRLAQDGHKITTHETDAVALYEATGIAWYYILDTTNRQFKLPRTKWGFTGLRDSVGGYVAPGLPDHNHKIIINTKWGSKSANNGPNWCGDDATRATNIAATSTNASQSNSIYGASDTVQPPATQMYLYFYVGNFVEDITTIDAGKLAEVVNDFDINTFKPQVDEAKNSAITGISDAKTDAIDSLTNLATDLGTSLKYGNVGDIFYTSRLDVSLNGAVECNGNLYNTTDFGGAQSIGNLLRDSKVPYISLAEHQTTVDTYGSCRCFGWDGGTEFRVPKLADVFIEAGVAASEGEFISAGLPNITGTFQAGSGTYTAKFNNLTGAFGSSATGTGRDVDGGSSTATTIAKFDASKSNSIYGRSTTVQPPAVRYRAMVQLAFGATDDAVVTAGNVVADVSELNSHRVISFQAPTASNGYTWYRKYADGWVEQGGTVTTPSDTSSALVTLPIPMAPNQFFITNSSRQPINNWSAVPTVKKGEDGTKINVAIVPASGSGAWVSGTIDWQVSGMSA